MMSAQMSLVKVIEEPKESKAVGRDAGWMGYIKPQRCVPRVWTLELCISCTIAHQE